MNASLFLDPVSKQDSSATTYARMIVIDPRAQPLGGPKRGGMPYGSSFLREPEFDACEAKHQETLAAIERKAGIR